MAKVKGIKVLSFAKLQAVLMAFVGLALGARFKPTAFQAVSFQPPTRVGRGLKWRSIDTVRTRSQI